MTNLTSARRQVRVGKGELELFGRAPRRRRGVHPAAAVPGPVEGGPLGGGVPGARIPDEFHAWYAHTWKKNLCYQLRIIPLLQEEWNLQKQVISLKPQVIRSELDKGDKRQL